MILREGAVQALGPRDEILPLVTGRAPAALNGAAAQPRMN